MFLEILMKENQLKASEKELDNKSMFKEEKYSLIMEYGRMIKEKEEGN